MECEKSNSESLVSSLNVASAIPSTSFQNSSNSVSSIEYMMPDVIQRKFYQLSSTLKETGKYLNNIDTVLYEYRDVGKQKNDTIFQLKNDLISTLQRLNFSNETNPAVHLHESPMKSSVETTKSGLDSTINDKSQNVKPIASCSTDHSNHVHQTSDENHHEVKESNDVTIRLQAADRNYFKMKKRATSIIHKWKKRCRNSEKEVELQNKLIEDLQLMNVEMSRTNDRLMGKIDDLTNRIEITDVKNKNIFELEKQMISIAEKHETIMKEINELKTSLHLEKSVTKNLRKANQALQTVGIKNEETTKTLRYEQEQLKTSTEKLKEENLILSKQCQQLQNELLLKENTIQESTLRQEEMAENVRKAVGGKSILDLEYQNIFRHIDSQLDATIKHLSRNSREELKVFSSQFPQHDIRLCIAEFQTKLSWLLEEMQNTSSTNRVCCKKNDRHNCSLPQTHDPTSTNVILADE